MKINISIKTKNNLDPLTTSAAHIEGLMAHLLEQEAKKLRDMMCNNTRKAIMDKNGNTIGYNYTIVV